jgi:hypothetical protein
LTVRTWDGQGLYPRLPGARRTPIAHSDVLGWLEKERLPHSSSTVDELVEALNTMRVTVPAWDALSYDPANEAAAACKAMVSLLPILIETSAEEEAKAAARSDLVSAARHRERKDEFREFLPALHKIDKFMVATQPPAHKAQAWHADAMWLVFILRATEPADNPISFVSSNGPGTRFIRDALKRACQLHLSEGAIARAISRFTKCRVPDRSSSP